MAGLRTAIFGGLVLAGLSLLGPAPHSQEIVEASPPNEKTLLFVGDVMLSRAVGARMRSKGDWTYPFQEIGETLRAADLTFGNLECPISDAGRNRHHLYSFRADPQAVEGLQYAGFDVMSVANNHMYDWGPEALLDTLRRLEDAGIVAVGAGADDFAAHHPRVVDLDGVRLAFLAYVRVEPKTAMAGPEKPGVAWLEPERVLSDIRFARRLADVVIVSLHWGVEYATRPQAEQIELAHRMIDAGADLVVGGHPHVVQPVEEYGNRWIAYSLGNFVFDQKSAATHRGMMLSVKITDGRISEVTPIFTAIGATFQAAVAPEEEEVREARRGGEEVELEAIRAQ